MFQKKSFEGEPLYSPQMNLFLYYFYYLHYFSYKFLHNLAERLNYFSEKFDPKLFLSRIHQDTSASELESGALAVKTDLKGRTLQKKQLVKENFDCFVSCKTTIDGELCVL